MGKGAENERTKCKEWSLWWTGGERDDVFWRTSTSGGRASTRKKQGLKTAGSYGDMTAIDPIGQPLIDCCTFEHKKGYKKLSILDSIDSRQKETLLEGFFRQVVADAAEAGNYPVLIVHRDRHKPVVFIPTELGQEIFDFTPIGVLTPKGKISNVTFLYGQMKFMLFPQDYFFIWVNPHFFIQRAENRKGI